jgi:hypothetical protein
LLWYGLEKSKKSVRSIEMKRVTIILFALFYISGCASFRHYEYRYRIFYGVELGDAENLTPEDFSRLFYPTGALNNAMDNFGDLGFELFQYQQLGQGHNYLFKFRRPLSGNDRGLRGKVRVNGVYQIKREKENPVFAVIPTVKGYEIIEIKGIKKRYSATLENGEIVFTTGEGENYLSFREDGSVEHKIQKKEGNITVSRTYRGKKLSK